MPWDVVDLLRTPRRKRAVFCRDCGEPECVCYREALAADAESRLRWELAVETAQAFAEARAWRLRGMR
jgi:hypothetical protein